MLVIPAIDLKNGKCVRLIQGRFDSETVFSDDPVKVAMTWQEKGAKFLHVVDLDGALIGKPQNLEVIERIARAVSIPIEVGGGIRDEHSLKTMFEIGVHRAILGTSAVENPEFVREMCLKYDERIAVGIDAKDGLVMIKGWIENGKVEAISLASQVRSLGVKVVIYTDVKRDGTLSGPNVDATRRLAQAIPGVNVIASGGVSTIEDVKNLKKLEEFGVTGVIIGKALYTGNISLEEAIKIAS